MKYLLFIAAIFLLTVKAQAQNVGIGTTDPLARLHVTDSNVLFSSIGDIPATPGNTPISGTGRRMMWYADKAAFRAGFAAGTDWNINNIGNYSFASGARTIASGNYSTAMGQFTTASGYASSSIGGNTSASNHYATAMGYLSIASGSASTSTGFSTTAKAVGSFTTGIFNNNSDNPAPSASFPTDRIFQIGNGNSEATRSNAVTVLKNGRTGIGTISPLTRLHVADSSVLFSAPGFPIGTGNPPPLQGPGRRMMWYVDKAAFRVGAAAASEWDHDSIGNFSFASGYNTKAKGSASVALGVDNNALGVYSAAIGSNNNTTGAVAFAAGGGNLASGQYSVAMGASNIASGDYSTALGITTIASGNSAIATGALTSASGFYSTAMGHTTIASGFASTSLGYSTKAKWGASLVIGQFNDTTAVTSLFEIGNGDSAAARKNALTVLLNGNTGMGTITPGARLHIATGSSGYAGGYFPGAVVESNANGYLNFLAPAGNETGLLFGKPTDAAHGGIVYNNAAHPNGMEFRTNGNITRMVLIDNGSLGIGVSDPFYKLDVGDRIRLRSANNSAGIWLNDDVNATSPAFIGMKANDEVGFYGQSGGPGWRFYINTTTGNGWMQGTLTQNSDMRLKKDISPIQNSLQKITRLNGYTYHWKNENADSRLQTGVLAQEVQKLFPELVTENKEGILAVNYSGLIPVMIESIKEQQKQIDELKKLVERILK
jgi:Chaperone of endosialidase/Head domain of trimeric autotransporter adhesin